MNAHGFIPAAKIFGYAFLLATAAVICLGIYFYSSTKAFLARAVSCRGQVVEMKSVQNSDDNGTTYAPVFTFSDAAGVVHRSQSSVSTNPPAYAVGEPIMLRYDAKSPDDVRVDSFWGVWLGPLVCGIVAVGFMFVSLIFIVVAPLTIRKVWPQTLPPPPLPFNPPM